MQWDRHRRFVSMLLFTFVCFVCSVMGQTETATVSGHITDNSGAAMVRAEVQLQSVDLEKATIALTNDSGIYVFSSVRPGRYQVRVAKAGFKQVDLLGLIVNVQDHIEQNFSLQVGSVSESVTVTGGAPLVDTESSAVSTVVDRQFVENLPLNGRSFQALIETTPGVVATSTNIYGDNGQFNVDGQRADSNYFTVDGVSANFAVATSNLYGQFANGSIPAFSALGSSNNLVSIDALQEFRIQTSTYAAEYGRMSGAQVALITRSGTNQLHGTLFEYLRNDIFDANDWFADNLGLSKPGVRQNDFGGVFGGPIVKSKTLFFLSYEGLRLRQPRVAISDVPSLHAREVAPAAMQALLDAYPLPNGPSTGFELNEFHASFSDPESLNATSIRIDQTLGSKINAFARYNYSTSEVNQRNIGGYSAASSVIHIPVNVQTLTLGATGIVSPTIFNDFRFNYSRAYAGQFYRPDKIGGAVVPDTNSVWPAQFGAFQENHFGIALAPARFGNYQMGATTENEQHQINLIDSLSINKGTHEIKFGVDFRRLTPTISPHVGAITFYPIFFSMASAIGGVADAILEFNAPQPPELLFHNLSVFAQDSWKRTPRLTLTYGIRWEHNPPPTETTGRPPYALTQIHDLSTMALASRGTPLWKSEWATFAPRFGVSYALTNNVDRPTVLRAGFGIFYDMGTGQAGFLDSGGMFPYSGFGLPLNVPLPYTGGLPSVSFSTPYPAMKGFDPNLKMPYSPQWSVALDRAITSSQSVSLTYLGSLGRRLDWEQFINIPNQTFQQIMLTTNQGYSSYNAFQLQFRRRLSRGLQALVSYTWSHSLDVTSSDSNNSGVPFGLYKPQQDYGNSDFDVRHAARVAFTYDLPGNTISNPIAKGLISNWAIDGIIQAQTATPFSVLYTPNSQYASYLQGPVSLRPDQVIGQPVYLQDSTAPGGKRLNPAAFSIPSVIGQGTESRNSIRAFNLFQTDLSLRRQFQITEHWVLLFRGDAFNIFNHPNFGPPSPYIDQGGFGLASATLAQSLGSGGSSGFNPLYQVGGPRSIQVSAKLQF